MPEVRRHRQAGARAALTLLLALACEAPATTQSLQTRWIRAIGTIPPPDVVARVARDAEPYSYPDGSRPELKQATFKAVAVERCGSLQPGYAQAFNDRNDEVEFNEAAPVGSDLYKAKWPACLWARQMQYVVRSGETYSTILEKVSGQGLGVAPRDITAGEQLTLIATEPTELKIPGERLDDFLRFIASHTRDGVRSAVSGVPPTTIGNIVEPLGASTIAGTPYDCAATDPPFDGAAVLAAYLHASKDRDPDKVEVVVVDNGFFGLACGEDGCPRYVDPWSNIFPKGLFKRNNEDYAAYAHIGPAIFASLPPSNYALDHLSYATRSTPQIISDVEGHGTHVAGLALGGPGLYRDDWRERVYGASPWLRLLILSVAPASREISDIAAKGIFTRLRLPRPLVVNMSFVLNLDEAVEEDMDKAFRDQENSLFVVAAGNGGADRDGDDVGSLYPASKGGAGSESNVVTVAALEGAGPASSDVRLARFSNHGDAVDLAAPGCKVRSWIGGTDRTVPISGTSQAAPLVTFTASLMRSIWETSPRALKQRLILSGDHQPCTSFEDSPAPRCVSGQVRLNIPKALLIRDDIIRFRDRTLSSAEHPNGQPRLAFGRILRDDFLNLAHCGTPLRGVKRTPVGGLVAYTGPKKLAICSAAMSDADQAAIKVPFELHGDIIEGSPDLENDGGIVPSDRPIEREIALSDVDDIVFASERPPQ